MRALVYDGKQLKLEASRPMPAAGDGDVLVRVKQAGICGTDLEILRGYSNFTGIFGHEFVGVVEEAPDRKLVGKRVVGEINCVCGRCDMCLQGLSNHCRNRTVVGIVGRAGVFADYVRLPAANLHEVPDSVDDDAATFVEPLAAAFQAQHQLAQKLNARSFVTVLGAGRLGLLVAQVLRNAGAPVRVVGKHAGKLQLCEKWGIKARQIGDIQLRRDQDIVVDCTGRATGLTAAMQMLRPRGTLLLKSTVALSSAAGTTVDLSPLVVDEINVVGSRCGPFRPAIRALAEQKVDVHSMISRRVPFKDAIDAMKLAAGRDVLKVLMVM